MRVLVADDDVTFRTVLAAMLRQWGYEVVLACDGSEAWVALHRDNGPQLAILDWSMPVMEGIEVCRRLRNRDSDRYVYVLLLTAKTSLEDLVFAMESGADDFVAKPFNAQELRARLRAGRRIVELQEKLLEVRLERTAVGVAERSPLVRTADGVFVPGTRGVAAPGVPAWPATGAAGSGWSIPAELRAATAGDDELLAALLAEFKADTAARLRRIENAHASGDLGAIRAGLIAIKGGARHVGAAGFAACCDELESSLAAGSSPTTPDLERLRAAFDELLKFAGGPVAEAAAPEVSPAHLGFTA